MHKLGCIALILEGVFEEGVAHTDHALLGAAIYVVAQLLEPHPVVGVARLHDLVCQKLVHNIDVVNDVEDQCFNFYEE